MKYSRLDYYCTLHVKEESSSCVDASSCCVEKRLHPCCKKLYSFFSTSKGVDQSQHNGTDLKVHWSTLLDSGGEHRHVISHPFHFQGNSICGCVILVNLHPWGFMTKIIKELHSQKRGVKGVCQGQEQYVSTEALCGSPIHLFLISGDCWAGKQSVLHEQMVPMTESFIQPVAFFYEVPSIVSGLCVTWAVTNCLTFKKVWESYKYLARKLDTSRFTFLWEGRDCFVFYIWTMPHVRDFGLTQAPQQVL